MSFYSARFILRLIVFTLRGESPLLGNGFSLDCTLYLSLRSFFIELPLASKIVDAKLNWLLGRPLFVRIAFIVAQWFLSVYWFLSAYSSFFLAAIAALITLGRCAQVDGPDRLDFLRLQWVSPCEVLAMSWFFFGSQVLLALRSVLR